MTRLPRTNYCCRRFRISKVPSSPPVGTTDVGFEFDKEIFPKFALGISGDYLNLKPDGEPSSSGFDDFTLSAKYQLWQNDAHEAIFSIGGEWEIGGSGSQQVGADSRSTFTPTIYFGKGFGDLPDALKYARPFAITGTLGEDLPTSAEPNSLEWGLALGIQPALSAIAGEGHRSAATFQKHDSAGGIFL